MRDFLITALAPLSWGTTYYVTTEFLPPERPLLVGTLRALPVGLLIVLAYHKLPPNLQAWARLIVLGFLNFGAFFGLLFVAAYHLPGGVAATMGAIQPLVVTLLAWLWLGEQPRKRTIGLSVFSILGVALLVLGPNARLDGLGIVVALIATLSMATGTVLTRRWGRPADFSLLLFTGWQLLWGGLFLLPLAWLIEGGLPVFKLGNLAGFAYIGLVNTGLAYVCWFRGLQRLPASRITFLSLLAPVVAVLLGLIMLGQTLSFLQLIGIAIILTSVILAQLTTTRPPNKALSQPALKRASQPKGSF